MKRLRPTPQTSAPDSTSPLPHSIDAALVDQFLARLKVTPIPDTRLVDISFTAHDPALAAQVANAFARIHIDHNLETRFAASQEAVDWLNLRVQDIRAKVEKAELALKAYKKRHSTVSLKEHENVVVQQLAELNSELIAANTKFIEVQTLYREFKRMAQQPVLVDALPFMTNVENKLVQNLKAEHAALRNQIPAMLEIKAKMKSLEDEMRSEVNKIIRGIETDYKVVKARRNALQAAFERKKEEAQQLNTIGIQYGVLQREAESNRRLYDALLNSMKQTSVSAGLKRNNIRLVDAAEVPRGAIRPRPVSTLMRSALIALLLGCGLAWILESFNTTVQGGGLG